MRKVHSLMCLALSFLVLSNPTLAAQELPVVVDDSVTPSASPLDLPVEDLKTLLSPAMRCDWVQIDGNERCDIHWREPWYWMSIWRTPEGTVDYVSISAMRQWEGFNDGEKFNFETLETKLQQAAAVDAVMALFPEWKNGRQWLTDTFRRTTQNGHEAAIRVGTTTIYVGFSSPTTVDGTFVEVLLTKQTDLCRFREQIGPYGVVCKK